MPQMVDAHMSLSLDGFGTGEGQSFEKPFGDIEGEPLHRWMFEDAANNQSEIAAITDYGAFIMGRNMFGVGKGPIEPGWQGWWGPNPPYHAPVYVLTHYPRETLVMEGGTSFHFVTEGAEIALELARQAAGDRNVAVAGGVSTLRTYLNSGLLDRLYLTIAPIVLHRGERLWNGLTAQLEPVAARHTRLTTHLEYRVVR